MAFTIMLGSGCASIVHGGYRQIDLSTTPSKADVVITKAGSSEVVLEGKTPITFSLNPKRSYFHGQAYEVLVSKPGYAEVRYLIGPTISGWYWGNLLAGGLIGMLAVDPLTGAMWNLQGPQRTLQLRLIDGDQQQVAGEEASSPIPLRPVKQTSVRARQAAAPPTVPPAATRKSRPMAEAQAPEDDAALYDKTYDNYLRVVQRLEAAKHKLAATPDDSALQDQVQMLESVRAGLKSTLREIASRNNWIQ